MAKPKDLGNVYAPIEDESVPTGLKVLAGLVLLTVLTLIVWFVSALAQAGFLVIPVV